MNPASILVTDDESNIRMMVRTALESEGYRVLEAANGRQALEVLKRSSPQLMVLDLNMPELDGMAVLEQMKTLSSLNKPRVIVLTAYGSIATAVKATRLGASDFLEKPLTPADLRNSVRNVLDEPEGDYFPIAQELTDSYERTVESVRESLRLADTVSAEMLLTKVADRRDLHAAEYYNLLGALYETEHKGRLAWKCYAKALSADEKYAPAQINMRRLQQLKTKGSVNEGIALGDQPTDVWHARMPDLNSK